MAADIQAKLLSVSWRGEFFPTSSFEEEIAQDLAIHKPTDRDGAFVEGTGRAQLRFRATIPFLNGIKRAPRDLWKDPLYPTQYLACRFEAARKGPGILTHPESGPVQCKLENWKTVWASQNNRDGVIVDASWVESLETENDPDFLSAPSAIAEVEATAIALDTDVLKHNLNALRIKLPTYTSSFEDLARSIQGLGDQLSRISAKVSGGGPLGTILYRLKNIEQSLNRQPSATNWPLYQSIGRMRAAVYDLKKTVETPRRPVAVFVTDRETTLSALANDLKTNINDMFNLNPSTLSSPTIQRGTRIRYYT